MSVKRTEDVGGTIPPWLCHVPLDHLTRIDVGLEGNWSETVTEVWCRSRGLVGFDRIVGGHPRFRPALELYLPDGWIGILCFRRCHGQNVFDERKARAIIAHVEQRLGRMT